MSSSHRAGGAPRPRLARSAPLLCCACTVVLASATLPAHAADAPSPGPAASTETVVVTANKLAVETLIDRKVYTLQADVQSSFGTVSDVLSVIPSIDVDADGNVSLRGDTNVLILVDGRPSAQFAGPSAGDNLQSIPARDIERIEVITHPPAQYKADGTAGVINIITRKKREAGLAGALQGSLGSSGRSIVGANATYGSGPLTASVTATYRQDYRRRLIRSDVIAPDPSTGQLVASHSSIDETIHRNVPPVGFSVRYSINDRQEVSLEASRSGRAGLRTYTELNDAIVAPATVVGSTERLSAGHDREVDGDGRVGFTQKLSRPGEVLELSLHRTSSHENEHYDYTNFGYVPPAPTDYSNLGFHEDRAATEAGVDYTLPFSKVRVLKVGFAVEQDAYEYGAAGQNIDPATGTPVPDPALTNEFRFHQRIGAAYLSYQYSLGTWNWLGGLRGEGTRTEARQITEAVTTAGSYARLYPSLHVDHGLSDQSTLSFGASRRITRPDPDNLNPYVDYEYTPNLRAGNPDLKPQFTQSYEAGYGFEGPGLTCALTAYYRRNKDGVTDLTQNLGNGVTLTTKTNLPRSDSSGLEFTASGHIVPKLAYSVSGNLFYSQIDATALGAPGLESTTGVNAKVKLDYRPGAADAAQITASRTGRRLTPQGYVQAINIVNLGYRHPFARDLMAVVTVSDVFNGQRFVRTAVTPSFAEDYSRFVHGRIVYLGLVYAFGATKKEKPANFEYDP